LKFYTAESLLLLELISGLFLFSNRHNFVKTINNHFFVLHVPNKSATSTAGVNQHSSTHPSEVPAAGEVIC